MFKFVVLSALVACALGAAIPDGLLPQLDGRIVGGSATTIDKYPYQISLQRGGSHYCGGCIYSRTVIITAAHCLQDVEAVSTLKVRAGSTSRSRGGTLASVVRYVNHPKYSPKTMANDIAVITLSSPLTLGAGIQTIPLATDAPASGTAAVVSGWGAFYSDGPSPDILYFVNVNIIDRRTCASRSYDYGSEIGDTMICASARSKDACQGDSGGPLAAGGKLVGVVSWGYGCADSRYPGVYSDVLVLKSWILANI